MNMPPPRTTLALKYGLGIVALALGAATSAGVASATTEPADPASSAAPGEMAPGCPEITALLQAQDAFLGAYLNEDGAETVSILASLPALGDAAAAAAPAEITDAVTAFVEPFTMIEDILGGVTSTDVESLTEVFSSAPPTPESDAAGELVIAWATDNCGYVALDPFADAPEPPDCEILDAAAAVAAAGLDVDVTDFDGSGDFNLPGYATKSCSYGNGAMTLATISYTTLDQATQFFVDNMEGGEFVDVDLGSLPASTLVTLQGGLLAVSVLEAPVPFSVGFMETSAVTPEAAVAAAEAVLAALPAEIPMPGSSEAP